MAECAKECDLELDCMAIYRNQNNGYCYMRQTVTGKPVKNAAYGFHRRCGYSEFNCTATAVTVPEVDACKECATSGYTYEQRVYMGNTLRKITNKSWQECAAECDKAEFSIFILNI